MFVFSFRGLGFLVPVVMIAPVIICFLALNQMPGVQFKTILIACGVVALISPVITYGLGKYMNRDGVRHAFGEIRFEHWGIIQFSGFGLIISLILLNIFIDHVESGFVFDSWPWLQKNIFLVYLSILLMSPMLLFIYIRRKMRAMNSDLNDA